MAVRIVDEKPGPKIVRNAVCCECGVKVEFLPIDIKEREYMDYSGTSDTFYWVDCPKCQNKIEVSRFQR